MLVLLKTYWKLLLYILGGILLFILLYQNSTAFRFVLSKVFFQQSIDLEQTVLTIKEVNGISEWITAEYYGEALYSLSEYREEAKTPQSGRFVPFSEIDSLHLFYIWKDSAESWYDRWHHELAVSEVKYEQYRDTGMMVKTPLFAEFHRLLGERREKKTFQFIQENFLHSTKYRRNITKLLDTKEYALIGNPKRDLVLLGRGWVKAGFDLEKLTAETLKTEQRADTLFIEGMPDPHVITSSINPWFIPDQLRGYEIVFKAKSTKLSSEDVKQVKVGCKDKLEEAALENGLMETAWTSAESSMLSMLQLLGEEEISIVVLVR